MRKKNTTTTTTPKPPDSPKDGPRLTTVDMTIEGDPPLYTARTGHVPDLVGIGPTEAQAFSALSDAIRQYRRSYEEKDQPVPWDDAEPKPFDKNTIRRQIRGLRPVKTKTP